MIPRIFAGDLSLTASGLAHTNGTVTTYKPRFRGVLRLADIRDHLIIHAADAHLVILEGYSYDSRHQAHQMGELGGVVRLALHEAGIPWHVIPPNTLKLYATGRGNASKDEMLAEAIRRLDYQGKDHNEADALWLRALALHHYGHPIVKLPQANLRALLPAKPKRGKPTPKPWPTLAELGLDDAAGVA